MESDMSKAVFLVTVTESIPNCFVTSTSNITGNCNKRKSKTNTKKRKTRNEVLCSRSSEKENFDLETKTPSSPSSSVSDCETSNRNFCQLWFPVKCPSRHLLNDRGKKAWKWLTVKKTEGLLFFQVLRTTLKKPTAVVGVMTFKSAEELTEIIGCFEVDFSDMDDSCGRRMLWLQRHHFFDDCNEDWNRLLGIAVELIENCSEDCRPPVAFNQDFVLNRWLMIEKITSCFTEVQCQSLTRSDFFAKPVVCARRISLSSSSPKGAEFPVRRMSKLEILWLFFQMYCRKALNCPVPEFLFRNFVNTTGLDLTAGFPLQCWRRGLYVKKVHVEGICDCADVVNRNIMILMNLSVSTYPGIYEQLASSFDCYWQEYQQSLATASSVFDTMEKRRRECTNSLLFTSVMLNEMYKENISQMPTDFQPNAVEEWTRRMKIYDENKFSRQNLYGTIFEKAYPVCDAQKWFFLRLYGNDIRGCVSERRRFKRLKLSTLNEATFGLSVLKDSDSINCTGHAVAVDNICRSNHASKAAADWIRACSLEQLDDEELMLSCFSDAEFCSGGNGNNSSEVGLPALWKTVSFSLEAAAATRMPIWMSQRGKHPVFYTCIPVEEEKQRENEDEDDDENAKDKKAACRTKGTHLKSMEQNDDDDDAMSFSLDEKSDNNEDNNDDAISCASLFSRRSDDASQNEEEEEKEQEEEDKEIFYERESENCESKGSGTEEEEEEEEEEEDYCRSEKDDDVRVFCGSMEECLEAFILEDGFSHEYITNVMHVSTLAFDIDLYRNVDSEDDDDGEATLFERQVATDCIDLMETVVGSILTRNTATKDMMSRARHFVFKSRSCSGKKGQKKQKQERDAKKKVSRNGGEPEKSGFHYYVSFPTDVVFSCQAAAQVTKLLESTRFLYPKTLGRTTFVGGCRKIVFDKIFPERISRATGKGLRLPFQRKSNGGDKKLELILSKINDTKHFFLLHVDNNNDDDDGAILFRPKASDVFAHASKGFVSGRVISAISEVVPVDDERFIAHLRNCHMEKVVENRGYWKLQDIVYCLNRKCFFLEVDKSNDDSFLIKRLESVLQDLWFSQEMPRKLERHLKKVRGHGNSHYDESEIEILCQHASITFNRSRNRFFLSWGIRGLRHHHQTTFPVCPLRKHRKPLSGDGVEISCYLFEKCLYVNFGVSCFKTACKDRRFSHLLPSMKFIPAFLFPLIRKEWLHFLISHKKTLLLAEVAEISASRKRRRNKNVKGRKHEEEDGENRNQKEDEEEDDDDENESSFVNSLNITSFLPSSRFEREDLNTSFYPDEPCSWGFLLKGLDDVLILYGFVPTAGFVCRTVYNTFAVFSKDSVTFTDKKSVFAAFLKSGNDRTSWIPPQIVDNVCRK